MTKDQSTPPARLDWLILVPTQFELNLIGQKLPSDLAAACELCGFGPIIPAARTVQLIQQHQPSRVLLMGIAGAYLDRLSIGNAAVFSTVSCYGVGAGSSDNFRTAETMGWKQWSGDTKESCIGDRIMLAHPENIDTSAENATRGLLVTATSAAAEQADVDNRLRVFPEAVAEDMEAFGVAAACRLSDVPLFVVRGISNRAGDRDKSNWKIEEALDSAVRQSLMLIRAES